MEPNDDILNPTEPSRPAWRLRPKHVLRALALLLMAAALGYVVKVLAIDSTARAELRRLDLLTSLPIFVFGVLLWWYAGRGLDEFSRPLFRGKGDAETDVRVDLRNIFWLGASLTSGFVGMSALIIGLVFDRHGEELRKVMPEFFDILEKRLPPLHNLETSPGPLIMTGVLLVLLAAVTLALAMRRRRPAA
jgi:hypothetical protein